MDLESSFDSKTAEPRAMLQAVRFADQLQSRSRTDARVSQRWAGTLNDSQTGFGNRHQYRRPAELERGSESESEQPASWNLAKPHRA